MANQPKMFHVEQCVAITLRYRRGHQAHRTEAPKAGSSDVASVTRTARN
jgi:hypothetical protein